MDEVGTAHIVCFALILLFLMSKNLILKTTQCGFSFDVCEAFFFFFLSNCVQSCKESLSAEVS